ncbi:sugar transferase [Phycisphaerales bacterium AB-hyl4]|uniref:Sugar transferase n=1 Tax=Natronomicrosphaera hydrolytica TaxID=3242702 RepID=A0ABV4U6V3_9BACT
MKRLFDVFASGFALLLVGPMFLLVMLILRLTGEGKVWYRQPRVGYKGREFQVLKFVTMLEKSESMGTQDITLRNDPRVLPVGRVLRKAKINELPQIINILKGDMSVVGWRPLMPKSFAMYPEHVQAQIINVPPGLTGIGSIIFRDEEAIVEASDLEPREVYEQIIAPYKGELELWYQKHQSFWLDMKIIFATAWMVLRPTSTAYLRWFSNLPPRPEALEPKATRGRHEPAASA